MGLMDGQKKQKRNQQQHSNTIVDYMIFKFVAPHCNIDESGLELSYLWSTLQFVLKFRTSEFDAAKILLDLNQNSRKILVNLIDPNLKCKKVWCEYLLTLLKLISASSGEENKFIDKNGKLLSSSSSSSWSSLKLDEIVSVLVKTTGQHNKSELAYIVLFSVCAYYFQVYSFGLESISNDASSYEKTYFVAFHSLTNLKTGDDLSNVDDKTIDINYKNLPDQRTKAIQKAMRCLNALGYSNPKSSVQDTLTKLSTTHWWFGASLIDALLIPKNVKFARQLLSKCDKLFKTSANYTPSYYLSLQLSTKFEIQKFFEYFTILIADLENQRPQQQSSVANKSNHFFELNNLEDSAKSQAPCVIEYSLQNIAQTFFSNLVELLKLKFSTESNTSNRFHLITYLLILSQYVQNMTDIIQIDADDLKPIILNEPYQCKIFYYCVGYELLQIIQKPLTNSEHDEFLISKIRAKMAELSDFSVELKFLEFIKAEMGEIKQILLGA